MNLDYIWLKLGSIDGNMPCKAARVLIAVAFLIIL